MRLLIDPFDFERGRECCTDWRLYFIESVTGTPAVIVCCNGDPFDLIVLSSSWSCRLVKDPFDLDLAILSVSISLIEFAERDSAVFIRPVLVWLDAAIGFEFDDVGFNNWRFLRSASDKGSSNDRGSTAAKWSSSKTLSPIAIGSKYFASSSFRFLLTALISASIWRLSSSMFRPRGSCFCWVVKP